MNRRDFLRNTSILAGAIGLAPLARSASSNAFNRRPSGTGQQTVQGIVFHDRNGSGVREEGDPGIPGVSVSNGVDVVRTDRNGRWQLPARDNAVYFVIKPSSWKVPVNEVNLPQFFYVHRPNGSPAYRYPGLKATGPLPISIDFGLQKDNATDKFKMVLFGDPQPRDQKEIDFIAHDVVEQAAKEAKEIGASFGLSLGDEMFDVLSLFGSLNRTIGTIGLPWYNTLGNHDMNFDAPDNSTANETYISHYGPPCFAFNYGKVHFIVLNDVVWDGKAANKYHGELTKQQLEFVQNDLAFVPKDHLLFIAMHIPLVNVENREELYRLIEDRPHSVSVSAHTHVQAHHFIGQEAGWNGAEPHHHINNVTVCGSWWRGAPDERGIPHATMSDGAPNGYSIIEFDGPKYKVRFRAASRPADHQMSIFLPEVVSRADAPKTEMIVNVFAGSIKSTVDMRIDGGSWSPMQQFQGQDPFFAKLKELEAGPNPPPGLKLPGASVTRHLWKSTLPAGLTIGMHVIEVRTVDMFGQEYGDRRLFRVE